MYVTVVPLGNETLRQSVMSYIGTPARKAFEAAILLGE